MRMLCVNDGLAAAVVAVSVVRSAAFVCVAPASFSSSSQHQLATSSTSMLSPARQPAFRSGQVPDAMGRLRAPLPRAQLSRQTRLSAQADSMYPDGVPDLPGVKTVVETEEEEEQRAVREWQDDGRKGRVLVRRKEIPSPDMDAASVCQLIFESLQNNDDPMLDYGAAVAIKFASSKNAVKAMTPAEYGTFLRTDQDQALLVDNASCAPAARAKVSPDGRQVLQKVELVGRYPDDVRRIVDVQLTKEEDECWRVDAITLGPVAEKQK